MLKLLQWRHKSKGLAQSEAHLEKVLRVVTRLQSPRQSLRKSSFFRNTLCTFTQLGLKALQPSKVSALLLISFHQPALEGGTHHHG
jgi:hypothetical protein